MSPRRGIRVHRGVAAPLVRDNIDTDIIIRSRDMTVPTKTGFGDKLFASWRYRDGDGGGGADGADGPVEDPGFVLNQPAFRDASILVTGANFGCGSSREYAVWTLADFGFRCIVARSFGNIFHANCIVNGVVPVTLAAPQIDDLVERLTAGPPARPELTVDLVEEVVTTADGHRLSFRLQPRDREMLLNGWDHIDLTLGKDHLITAYQEADRRRHAWKYEAVDPRRHVHG